jgi:hypothetical protein
MQWGMIPRFHRAVSDKTALSKDCLGFEMSISCPLGPRGGRQSGHPGWSRACHSLELSLVSGGLCRSARPFFDCAPNRPFGQVTTGARGHRPQKDEGVAVIATTPWVTGRARGGEMGGRLFCQRARRPFVPGVPRPAGQSRPACGPPKQEATGRLTATVVDRCHALLGWSCRRVMRAIGQRVTAVG